MRLEIDQGYKESPVNHTLISFDTLEEGHEIFCVEKFHEMFGLNQTPIVAATPTQRN